MLEFVRYCLRLSSRRHAQHRSFSMVAFDILARHNALQAISIKAKISPGSMERTAGVSREALQEYVQYQKKRLEAILHQLPVPEPPEIDVRVRELYASMSTGMRAFWGSNEERSGARANLFSMQLALGQPTIFFTISPDSSSTYRIANLAGVISNDVLEHMERDLDECLAFSRARLGQIASSNPYVCARYFDYLMKVFIEAVLNWDLERGCARKQPGLFGQTKSFFAATESQNSTGSLHAHMLIWIQKMPSTVEEYYDMCSLERFRATMVKYVDAIATSNVPLDTSSCPSCGNGTIVPLEIHRSAFCKARSGTVRPAMTSCQDCGINFGASELITKHAEQVAHTINSHDCGDAAIFRSIASFQPLERVPSPSSVEAIVAARALVTYQHHHWFHAKSCFKITKRTPKGNVCRMFMPKQICTETKWTTSNRIEMKSYPGNEYINTYVPIVNAVFKCNHDIKFLGAGEGPEKSYYTIKYTTKPQQDIENPWALHLHAFDKASQRLLSDPSDPVAIGRRRIQSMCCSLTSPHEVSAPMACLYILKGSVMYSSHLYAKLPLTMILRALFQSQEHLDVQLEGDGSGNTYKPSSVWFDYVYRPVELESENLMAFVAQWERRRSKSGKRFQNEHGLYETHTLFKTSTKRIVNVCQKRLPDIRRADLPNEERLRYRQSIMALFKPFRNGCDFTASNMTFDEFYRRWWETEAPSPAHEWAKHNTDYYVSRELLRTQQDPEVIRYNGYLASPGENDELGDDSFDDLAESDDDDDYRVDDSDNDEDPFDSVSAPVLPTKNIDMLENAAQCANLAAGSTVPDENRAEIIGNFTMSIEDVEHHMHSHASMSNSTIESESNHSLLDCYPDLPTRVNMLQQVLGNTGQPESSHLLATSLHEASPETLPLLPPLQHVSVAFQLNEKQHKMFAKIGASLLTSLLLGDKADTQTIAFLGGLPGAGKSRVIAALQALALKWKSPESVATAAYQGVAAQAANGQTIHKLFGWFVHNRRKWTPTKEQTERFAKLKLLILDEISTCDVSILGKIDASLRRLLDRPTELFGGIHVLLVGDWLQQLPVAGQAAFVSPDELLQSRRVRNVDSPEYLDRIRGINAYRALNLVVILTENMRHKGDPAWRSILDKWRVGEYDDDDIQLVNKVAHEENWTSQRATLKGFCPIIVTSNALRVEFNVSAIREFCQLAKVALHRFPASVTREKHRLTQIQRKSLDCIRDDKTSGMPMVLEIAIGSTVQCTKNVSPLFKLANGSIGTIVAITPARDDVVQQSVVNGVSEHLHSLPPDIVYVQLKDYVTCSFIGYFV